jgi:glycerophosphoryl diester phosphodiesterase
VIGHRGNAAFAPENTVVSFEQAIAAGADALEMDVHISADGEAVVVHDATLERTTGTRGVVARMSLAHLRRADAGARFSADGGRSFPYRGTGVTIPTLAEVFERFPDVPLVIELKTPAVERRVLELIHEYGAAGRVVVASFSSGAVAALRAGGIITGASRAELSRLYASSLVPFSATPPPYRAVFAPRRYWGVQLPMTPLLRVAARSGITIHTWVENDPSAALRLWRAGISGVVTDDPGRLARARLAGLRIGHQPR